QPVEACSELRRVGRAVVVGFCGRCHLGVTFDIPDTPANAAAFGRPKTRRYGEAVDGGYPQIHAIFLSETGTHLIVEAFIKRAKKSEFPLAGALLRKVPPHSLVLWDRGFYGYSSLVQAQLRKVQVVGRVADQVVFAVVRTLSDGSVLATIYPTWSDRRRRTNGLLVRVIEYTFDDPHRPGHGQRHRLVTTLLDANTHSATELVVLYHERWEIEIGNDELKTHQLDRLVHLRSRTPCGVLQELYGILLAYNAVRYFMHVAALSVDIDPRRLSFIHAVRVLRETAPLMRAAATERLPFLYAATIRHIAQGGLPPRDNRINPRVVKKKMSNPSQLRTCFPKKRPE
ncbi:MAG: IS4 family transposase, partial [Planctomycetota bacterium]